MSKQEARLIREEMVRRMFEAGVSCGCEDDSNLQNAVDVAMTALDEAKDEALAVVKRYHRLLGLGKKDCCDCSVDAALLAVESALKSKRGA